MCCKMPCHGEEELLSVRSAGNPPELHLWGRQFTGVGVRQYIAGEGGELVSKQFVTRYREMLFWLIPVPEPGGRVEEIGAGE